MRSARVSDIFWKMAAVIITYITYNLSVNKAHQLVAKRKKRNCYITLTIMGYFAQVGVIGGYNVSYLQVLQCSCIQDHWPCAPPNHTGFHCIALLCSTTVWSREASRWYCESICCRKASLAEARKHSCVIPFQGTKHSTTNSREPVRDLHLVWYCTMH